MDENFENQLKHLVRPLLKRGRSSDWEHTLRTIGYARYLLEHEGGEEEVVVPTLYLHDIGWSKVDLTKFVRPLTQKEKEETVRQHMEFGAVLADKILKKLAYDPALSRTIVSIVAVHDEPQEIFAMEDPSATVVFEADRLDRFGVQGQRRIAAIFGPEYLQGKHGERIASYLRKALKVWFKTETGRTMSEKLASEIEPHPRNEFPLF